MKKLLFLTIALVGILSFSCDKIKDATAIDIDTQLKADVPVSSQNAAALVVKSAKSIADDVYNFHGTGTFSLTDNADLKKYIDNIRDISANGESTLRFTGAPADGKIMTTVLNFGVETTPGAKPTMITAFTLPSEITATNGTIEVSNATMVSLLLAQLKNYKDKVIWLELSGTANYDIDTTAKLIIPVTVSASPL